MKHRTNPRRIPVTMQDVERAAQQARVEAVTNSMAIFFTVLFDRHGATQEELKVFWSEVNELSESIVKGFVSVSDLRNTLKREYGIEV